MRTKEDLIKQALKALPEATYIAQDKGGQWIAYEYKPVAMNASFHLSADRGKYKHLPAEDWKELIIEIPKLPKKKKMYIFTMQDSIGRIFDTSCYYESGETALGSTASDKVLRRLDDTMIG